MGDDYWATAHPAIVTRLTLPTRALSGWGRLLANPDALRCVQAVEALRGFARKTNSCNCQQMP
eukprot:15464155-Alexandrium_andersonii.AAC.1